MSNRYVDRPNFGLGLNTTERDSRLVPGTLRNSENFALPDNRLVRRQGFKPHDTNRITGQQLTKHQAVEMGFRDPGTNIRFGQYWRTPNSYAVLPYDVTFTPRTDVDWTLEFQLTMGEVELLTENFTTTLRQTNGTFTGGNHIRCHLGGGAILYDQTILTSDVNVFIAGVDESVRRPTNQNADLPDTIGITALRIYAGNGSLAVIATPFDTTTRYYNFDTPIFVSVPVAWTPDETHHIAVFYDASLRTLTLRVSGDQGSFENSYIIPASEVFPGEDDRINGRDRALQFQAVLLNESVARMGASSSCQMSASANACSYYTEFEGRRLGSDNSAQAPGRVDFLSAPRGTGMCELRWWSEVRNDSQLESGTLRHLEEPFSTTLKGYWPLDDGGSVLAELVRGYDGSTHGSPPPWVRTEGLLHGAGIKFTDNQFMSMKTREAFGRGYLQDIQLELQDVAKEGDIPESSTTFDMDISQQQSDLTVGMQFKTPAFFPQELSSQGSEGTPDPLRNVSFKYEVREKPHDTFAGLPIPYQLRDGGGRRIFRWDGNGGEFMFHPAFDQTLWSWEGRKLKNEITNIEDGTSLPLYRGLLTPDGRVAFEFYGDGQETADGVTWDRVGFFHRLTSDRVLEVNTIYDIHFRKTNIYEFVGDFQVIKGWKLEIIIDGILDSNTYETILAFTGENVEFPPASGNLQRPAGSPIEHVPNYTISVGASYTDDNRDRSYRTPRVVSGGDFFLDSPATVYGTKNGTMDDHPAQGITVSYFRMWKTGIEDVEIRRFRRQSISTETDSQSLILNYEVQNVGGALLANRARFPAAMVLDYKAFNQAEPILNSQNAFIQELFYWNLSDGLGYGRKPAAFEFREGELPFRMIGFHNRALEQSFGLLAIQNDTVYYDENFEGVLDDDEARVRDGLLSDYITGEFWDHANIGDRSFLASPGGSLKVFTGDSVYPVGLGIFRGGRPIAVSQNLINPVGTFPTDTFYKIVITYFSDEWNIEQIGSTSILKISPTDNSIGILNIPAHPDKRVTSFRIYRSLASDGTSIETVENAFVFRLAEGPFVNHGAVNISLKEGDDSTLEDILDIFVTPAPDGSFVTSWDGRLWISGNRFLPDTVFFSFSGFPEAFNTTRDQLLLEESSGDAINGMVAIFGALFIFKPKSLWRIDRLGDGFYDRVRVADIGADSNESIQVISMPDTGRTAIVFWSDVGPMLFDGVNLQNIGYQIEKREGSTRPYDWKRNIPVRTAHDRERRELIFFYVPIGSDRFDEAMAYNYRFNTWTRHTKLPGGVAVSSAEEKTEVLANNETFISQASVMYVAGNNGIIHRWGESTLDGFDDASIDGTNVSTVTGVNTEQDTITLSRLPSGNASVVLLRGMFITFVRPDGNGFRSAVIDTVTEPTLITLQTRYIDERAADYIIDIDDLVFIGQPPAWVELPWDNLDSLYDSTISEMLTWHTQKVWYRMSKDWGAVIAKNWIPLSDAKSTRKVTKPQITVEAVKLELYSPFIGAAIDQLGYRVDDKQAPGRQDQR